MTERDERRDIVCVRMYSGRHEQDFNSSTHCNMILYEPCPFEMQQSPVHAHTLKILGIEKNEVDT